MRRREVAVSFLLALTLGACSKTRDNTELVVTVWSDFDVPGEMDAVRIRVLGHEQTVDHPFQLSGDKHAGTFQIPVQLGLVPAGSKDLSVNVTAIGSYKGTDIVSQQAILPFIPDQARELVLYLARSCKNVVCPDSSGFTCESGACTKPVLRSTASLPTYVAGKPPASPDAGIASTNRDAAASTGGIMRGTGGLAGAGGGGRTPGGGGTQGLGGAAGTGGTSGFATGGDVVTFSSGRAVGVMNGWGWVSLGRDDVVTSPTCDSDGRYVTSTSPCSGTTNWASADGLCVSGTIPAVLGNDYNSSWGIQIGVNVTELSDGTLGRSYSTIALSTAGTVSPPGASVRAELHRSGDPTGSMYCAEIVPGRPVSLSSFNTSCWDGSGTWLQPADIPNIDKVGLQVSSSDTTAYTLSNFCWTGIVFGAAQQSDAGASPPTDAGRSQAAVTVDQAVLDFGNVDIGSTSAARTVTVTVSGATAAINPTVVGAGFAVSATTCSAPQPVGTCTIDVKFSPTAVGLASGSLTVGNVIVALTGVADAPGTFGATDRVDLGTLLVNTAATVVVQITPSGTLPSLSCLASGADLTLASQTCPAAGAVSAACTCTFTFKAATSGQKSETIMCSGGGKTTQTMVSATVVTPPGISISPTTATLSARVGETQTMTFNVANNGGATTGQLTAKITAGTTDYAITSNDCVVPLTSLATCKIQVAFSPKAAGARPGTLTVTDATVGSTAVTATLSGTAVAPAALTFTPASNDFGTVVVGQTKTTALTLSNTGGSATSVLSITTADTQFLVNNDFCSGHPLPAAGQCSLNVTFSPSSIGAQQTTLNATQSSDGVLLAAATLAGTGQAALTPAKLTFWPSALDFGMTGVGIPVSPKIFTISNTGETATGTLAVAKGDSTSSVGGASQFTLSATTCSSSLAPGATCQIAVTFAPTIAGSTSAVLTVSDGTVSASGAVVGIALSPPTLTLNCSPTTLDDTVVGDTSSAAACTIANPLGSQSPQESGAITLSVTGDFAVSTNNCTASLQPSSSCMVAVVFKPTAKGTRDGVLTVTSANGGGATAALSGRGLLPVEIVERVSSSVVTDYDFGQVGVLATSTTTAMLDVYVRASVGNIAISGTDLKLLSSEVAADFIQQPGGSSPPDCIAVTSTAPTPDKTTPFCRLLVAFRPQSKGAKATTIRATASGYGASDSATLRGTGISPLTITPSPLVFDSVVVGFSSTTPLTLSVCNQGANPATSPGFQIGGTDAADFVMVNDQLSGRTLYYNDNPCGYVALRLVIPKTATAGPRSATLTATATIAGVVETATVSLVGTAVSAAAMAAPAIRLASPNFSARLLE
jgi:hypothetical protein